MAHKITLLDNTQFMCPDDSRILDSAKNSGVLLEHSCRLGRCDACVVTIASGEAYCEIRKCTRSVGDKIYTCSSKPKSDLMLEANDLSALGIPSPNIGIAKVSQISRIGEHWVLLKLRLAPKIKFRYKPGQYVDFLLQNNQRRSFSIFKHTESENTLEFIISLKSEGLMTEMLINGLKDNDIIRFDGPHGTFCFRDTLKKKLLFVANGTGGAPIVNIIENEINDNRLSHFDEIRFFWGVREKGYVEQIYKLEIGKINLTVVESRVSEGGQIRYVQDAVKSSIADIENYIIYSCGSSDMLNGLRKIVFEQTDTLVNMYSEFFD